MKYISSTPKYFLTADRYGHDGYTANIIYEVTLKNLDFTNSNECVELRYFSLDELREVSLYPNVTKLVDYLNITNFNATM